MQDTIQQLYALAEDRRRRSAESKDFAVPVEYLGEEIHKLALEATGKSTIPEKNTLSVFFDERAIKLLKEVSINYYWFWKIVSIVAQKADRLPIKSDELSDSIKDLRSSIAEHADLNKPLCDLDQLELALCMAHGGAVLKRNADQSYSVEDNPLLRKSGCASVGMLETGLSMYE